MENAHFEWKTYGQGINVSKMLFGIKKYGKRIIKGEVIFVNYHRELKNGKGLSLADIIEYQAQKTFIGMSNAN